MKVALSQLNYHIGNFEGNKNKIIEQIQLAKQQQVDLVVFAELAISGYPPRDFLEFKDYVDKCISGIKDIASHCEGIAAVVGGPAYNHGEKGKALFNTAYFLNDCQIEKQINKTLLPTYDIFDEYRYFEPNTEFGIVEYKGEKLAITICEDLWNVDDVPMYRVNPMDELMQFNPDLMVNIAASPFHYKQAEIRKEVLKKNTDKYHIPLLYVNHVGAQTELLFDGGSLFMNAKGEIIQEAKYFEEDLLVFDTKDDTQKHIQDEKSEIALIHDALVIGVRNYFHKLGFTKAILGLSGGIDSAVTAAIAVEALGAENLLGVLMPSHYSSGHSVKDAEDLAKNYGMPYETLTIKEMYDSFESKLQPHFEGTQFDVTEENLQARIRGVLLMAFCNKFGHILLNTSNKSESAVGYGTLYGDMNGGLAVLGDVYKVQVFELAHYINRDQELIPNNTIVKPPSAELRPDQKDSDSLPDYDILDTILLEYIENRKGPQEIIAMGYDEALVKRILRMVNINEHKRYQTPPILRVSPKAFGMGRRIPIVAKYLS